MNDTPKFIGIGASRSGTTWLYQQLKAHPQVFIPGIRKEVNFFSAYYDKGIAWYRSLFVDASNIESSGEVSPSYLAHPLACQRIKYHLPACKLIVILRHPVDRSVSQWKYRVQKRAENRSFDLYIRDENEPVELGRYGKHLGKYYSVFDERNIFVLIFERVMADPEKTLSNIARFLDIDPKGFEVSKKDKPYNVSYIPKYKKAYNFAFHVKQKLRQSNFNGLVNFIKSIGVEKVFGRYEHTYRIDESLREELTNLFKSDITKLKMLIQDDIPEWD